MSFTSFTIRVNSRELWLHQKRVPDIGNPIFWFEISDIFEIEGELEHENRRLLGL